ncbi:MAG: asparaginase [Burkholderiaceae bacterium]
MIPRHVPLVETTRGGTPECVHYGSVAVVDTAGRLLASIGEPESLNFTRSALKPLQALPFVEDGGLAHFGWGSQELAMMCASHNGEAIHQKLARAMLDRAGFGETDLKCGCHVPIYYQATGETVPAGARFDQLANNCSGKHAGFLAFCRLHGTDPARYLEDGQPLQSRIRRKAYAAGGGAMAQGIDGCSAPNFALPLTRLAKLYVDLAASDDPALRAISFAMTRHPDLISGTARTDLAVMQAGAGDWVAKIGADGIQAIGVRSQGIGIAIRIADGNARALHAATVEVLQQLNLVKDPSGTPLAPFDAPAIHNWRGIETGGVVPVFKLRKH